MISTFDIATELHRCIADSFLRDGQAEAFDQRTDLLDVLDSLQLLRMVVPLESLYGIKVEDVELTPENLGTVEKMAAFVQRKRQETPAVSSGVSGAL